MGEDVNNPKVESFIPNDKQVEEAGFYPGRLDPLLTDDEIQDLTTREDRGMARPIPQYQPKDLDEFKQWQNNFYSFFRDSGGFEVGKRRFKAFQRFAILDPELVSQLFNEMREHYSKDDGFHDFSESLWQKLYQAYQEMSQLVDAGDRYVRPDGGEPDKYFLKR